VDGDISTFSHTDVSLQDDPSSVWWKVALGDEFRIKSVKIKNRYCGNSSDLAGCLCRLTDATVSLVDSEGTAVATQSVGDTCGKQDLLLEDFILFTPSSSPTVSSAPSTGPVEGFTYVGTSCVDASGNEHSYISFEFPPTSTDNDCMAWCSQNLHPDFVGINSDPSPSDLNCECLFSGGLPSDINPEIDYSPAADNFASYDGFGPVQSGNPNRSAKCYQYDVSRQSFSFMNIFLLLYYTSLITTSSSF
jgi:hypothetical protein